MKAYIFTSELFEGSVLFRYNQDSELVTFDCSNAVLDQKYLYLLYKLMPLTVEQLVANFKNTKHGTLTLQKKENVSFDEFWQKTYVNKASSKKKSRIKWEKMKPVDRDAAFNYWDTYIADLAPGVGIKYVETYLNSELWNN
jgi:hypothetical protein